MKRRYFYVVAIFAILTFAAVGLGVKPVTLSASANNNGDVPPPSDTLVAKMAKAEEHLRNLERTLDRIQQTRVITAEDNAALDGSGLALGDTLFEAFQEAAQSTHRAAETEGQEGNVGDLVYFESFEQNHVSRTEAIVARTENIQRGIDDGTIILKDQPTAKSSSVMFTKASFNDTPDNKESACAVKSPTGTRILIPCIAPCVAQNWVACATCIISKIPAGIQYYNQFRDCWNRCSGFWKFLCRAKCLAVFVYWIY